MPKSLGQSDAWDNLVQTSCHLSAPQLPAFAACLSHSFYGLSESANDAKQANCYFHSAQLLKSSAANFIHIASQEIEKILSQEVKILLTQMQINPASASKLHQKDGEMSLVSYEEMELKLSFSRASRTLELAYAEPLAALNMRFASMLEQENLSIAQNPFRPDVFLKALNTAWCKFNSEESAKAIALPLLSEYLFDLAPIYHALNQALIARNILPDLQESYRLKRKKNSVDPEHVEEAVKNEVTKRLEQYFSGYSQEESHSDASHYGSGHHQSDSLYPSSSMGANAMMPAPVNAELMHYLANVQKNMALHQLATGTQNAMRLSQVQQEMPAMFNTGVEKHTLDLLGKVFDGVLSDQNIPGPIKDLIGLLQVPVLKAALIDKNFFFKEAHPARRLIDLMSQYSASWDQQKGVEDPLFQTMQRNVLRVQKEFDQQLDLFDEVVNDLESFMQAEEAAAQEALQAPITRALQKEKYQQAGIAAKNEITLRINSGEVHTFVETFLENRWMKVLTLAFSVQEEKPHAIADAIKTMDDLIWSIQPKISLAQRQDMVNRLPAILARLNKWLSLIKWEDADRIEFFADLAECHASIVRSPLELSPEKQVEIAVEAAKIATERRLEKRKKNAEEASIKEKLEQEKKAQEIALEHAKLIQESKEHQKESEAEGDLPDLEEVAEQIEQSIEDAVDAVASLERGVWIQFTTKAQVQQKVRLAWISPMRSLFIFTSSQKEKSFSISVAELESSFKEKRASIISLDKVVDKALMQALEVDMKKTRQQQRDDQNENTLS